MKGNEFIRRTLKLAKQRGIEARVDKKRGKGSHVTLYYSDKHTVVRSPKDELKIGTFKAMLKQLDLSGNEF